MKTKVMNIKPQEVTKGGERTVRYKGSDGKMHDFSAKLPETAMIPERSKTVIKAGTEITLAQAHAIEGFDFKKVTSLSLGDNYSLYNSIAVNRGENGSYLTMAYMGYFCAMFKKVDGLYVQASQGLDMVQIQDISELATHLFEILKQTNYLVIEKITTANGNHTYEANSFDNDIILTYKEDIVMYGDDVIFETQDGKKVVPLINQRILKPGTTITLGEANAIPGFDFNKVGSININENFNRNIQFFVNTNENWWFYLYYYYNGSCNFSCDKEENYQTMSVETSYNYDTGGSYDEIKPLLEVALLEIAQQTNKLEIINFNTTSHEIDETKSWDDVIELTLNEDVAVWESLKIPSATGEPVRVLTEEDLTPDNGGNGDESPVFVVKVTKTIAGNDVTLTVDKSHEEVYAAIENGLVPIYVIKYIEQEPGADDVVYYATANVMYSLTGSASYIDPTNSERYDHVNQTVTLYEV